MMETIMNNIKKDTSPRRGFTLVELIGIMTIVAILAGLATLPMIGMIEQARFKAERDKLAMLAREAQASFRQDDYTVNLSMLPMDLPVDAAISGTGQPSMTSVTPAVFDATMPGSGEIFNENAWYARLAKLRGQTATAWTDGGDLEDIVYNAYHRRRLMIAGPYEARQQRYIILSFMFQGGPNLPNPPSPTPDYGRIELSASGTAYENWFNVIYNHQWGEKADSVPGGWDSKWSDSPRGSRNYMQRVFAQRIVQPRYTVTVNNNSHSYVETVASGTGTTTQTVYSDRVYVYANMRNMGAWNYSGLSLTVPGRDHQWPTPGKEPVMIFPTQDRNEGILEGRRVVIRRDVGTNADLGNQFGARIIDSFHINQNTTYTAQ